MIILGLVILVAAVVVGVVGVLSNSGSAHELTGGFSVFGVDVTVSTGTLFLYGIVVGAAALLGLSLILTGTRRTTRRADPADLAERPRHKQQHWFHRRAAPR